MTLIDKYKQLTEISLDWNQHINITAITDPMEFLQKNILDSLAIMGDPAIEKAFRIMDLGTGGGYPGLPLALNYPEKHFYLVDSVNKKLMVIDDIIHKLGIKNVTTIHARAEDLALDLNYRETFDLVVSRAVASMPTLAEYALPFVKKGGYFAAYKTTSAIQEINSAEKAINKLGGKIKKINLSESSESGHIVVLVEKLVETPMFFPRKAGEAKKNPIL